MGKTKTAAVVTVFEANIMSKKGRKAVANWMRKQAGFLEDFGPQLAKRFTARYLYK